MRRLPLFPLPVVLFPGGPMPLHIFEPRYRQMVAHCVEGDRTFGMLYHDPDRDGPFTPDEPGRVGCTAEILNYQPLPDGRSLVLVRGGERFQVEDGIESPHQYWECVAAPFADEDPAPGLRERRRSSVLLFYDVLEQVVRQPRPYPDIDVELETSFQLAQAIRVDPEWQQRLLESRSEAARLEQLDDLLRAILEAGPDEE